MKNYLPILLMAIIPTGIYAQKKISTRQPKTTLHEIVIGTTEQYEALPKLKFTPALKTEFEKLPAQNIWAKIKLKADEDYFYINTPNGTQKFRQYRDEGGEKGWNGYEMLGYAPALNFYAISNNSSSEGLGFAELFLLNAKTGFRYRIASFGDWHVSLPVPSQNKRFFLYYANTEYQHKNTDIGLLSFSPNDSKGRILKPVASFHSDEFGIEEVRWAGDRIVYVKGYQETFDNQKWIKTFKYYKAMIPGHYQSK